MWAARRLISAMMSSALSWGMTVAANSQSEVHQGRLGQALQFRDELGRDEDRGVVLGVHQRSSPIIPSNCSIASISVAP